MGRVRSQFFFRLFGRRNAFPLSLPCFFILCGLVLSFNGLCQDSSADTPLDSPSQDAQSPAPTVACVPVPSGAVAWWRTESNTVDSVANNDGFLRADILPTISYASGKVGAALNFASPVL